MKQKFFKVMFITMLTLMSISIGVVTFAAQPKPGIEPMWNKLLACSYGFEKVGTDKIHVVGITDAPPPYDAYVKVELQYLKDGKWEDYYTWERQEDYTAGVETTITVPKGYTYQLKITHQVRTMGTDEVIESYEQYSNKYIAILP